jgi:hypothetical protein
MKTRKRTSFFNVWLIILFVLSFINILISIITVITLNIASQGTVSEILKLAPAWSFYTSLLLSIIYSFFLYMIFKWKKWALYGLIGIWAISLIQNLVIGLQIIYSVLPLISFIILIIAIRPNWKYFD